MSDQRLLGYDLRCWPPPVWDAARRQRYLYREDASQVLSVDPLAWPPPAQSEAVLEEHCGAGFLGLHEGPEELAPLSNPDAVIIAVSVLAGAWSQAQRDTWDSLVLEPAGPGYASAGMRWLDEAPAPEGAHGLRFVGLDVADSGLLSGLSSCGEVQTAAKGSYGKHLNQWHLFEDLGPAQAFCMFADTFVPEHAPFFVYGLWVCENPGASAES
ncbi:MAG: hypothetical protein IT368_13050 [Candidatus Hydrogenedentes bacterium]|nr:hypothetical protein [Candidatus Hydrogenedentota bacterium]